MFSPSVVHPECYYVQAMLNSTSPVAILATYCVSILSNTVINTYESRLEEASRVEIFVSRRLLYGNAYSEQESFHLVSSGWAPTIELLQSLVGPW